MAHWLAPCDLLCLCTQANTYPEVALPTVDRMPPHGHYSGWRPANLPTEQSFGGISTKVSSFQMTGACAELTKTTQHQPCWSTPLVSAIKKWRKAHFFEFWATLTYKVKYSLKETKLNRYLTTTKYKEANKCSLHMITGPLIKDVKRLLKWKSAKTMTTGI